MWWVLHACAVSTTMEASRRSPARMRWWCTAPVANSGGMKASSAVMPPSRKSESTRTSAPPRTRRSASSHSAFTAAFSPSGPAAIG